MEIVPKVEDLLNGADVSAFPKEQIPDLLGKLESLKGRLYARLLTPTNGRPEGDRRLGVEEAAKKLNRSTDWLYRHADSLPFTVRIDSTVGFSQHGIERYLEEKQNVNNRT